MQITPEAQEKLQDLARRFRRGERGFHFGKIGGCHGAIPRLRPGPAARPGEKPYDVDGVRLFMTPAEYRALEPYTLGYARGLLVRRFRLNADCNACAALRVE